MDRLLPCYPEMSAQFDQDRREGRSFDALELFIRHFLCEGSVFATFGFEHLNEKGILTDLHLHDILSQNRFMSEYLNLLEEAIGEIDEQDIRRPNNSLRCVNKPIQFQTPTDIRRRHEAHRLFAKLTDSRQKLLHASTTQGASAKFIAFVNRVGTNVDVWRSGTHVLRDRCEGYMPRSLSDIVSAFQVADAMRSSLSSSELVCSEKA